MSNTLVPKDFYTRLELADLLQIPEHTLAVWAMRGKGPPYVKVGERLVRYRRSDVEAWLQKNTVSVENAP